MPDPDPKRLRAARNPPPNGAWLKFLGAYAVGIVNGAAVLYILIKLIRRLTQ